MLNPSLHSTVPTTATMQMETIKTRFGDITIDTGKVILFARGLLGMPEKHNFVVTNFPNPKMQQFMLLQSIDDPSLSFITLPLDMKNNIIAYNDLSGACRDLQFSETGVAVLLIVNVHRSVDQVRLSVNARAPLLVDADRRIGTQYVFSHDQYNVQHML